MSVRGSAALAACLLFACAATAGVGIGAGYGPWGQAADTPAPPPVRAGCTDVRVERGQTTRITGTEQKESICGTPGKDHIYARGGNDNVWGKDGDDRIWARNSRPDLVSGGGGNDWAQLDSCDTAGGIEKPKRDTKKCRGVVNAGNAAVNAVDYSSLTYLAVVECHSRNSNQYGFQMRLAEEPTILAVNTSRRPDWQFVSFIPLLYEWDPTILDWRQVVIRNAFWLWDWSIDVQDTEFFAVRNFWRAFQGRRIRTGFNHLSPTKTYQMRMKIRWYPTKHTKAGELEAVIGDHFGDYETDKSHSSCTFPAAPTPAGGLRLAAAQT